MNKHLIYMAPADADGGGAATPAAAPVAATPAAAPAPAALTDTALAAATLTEALGSLTDAPEVGADGKPVEKPEAKADDANVDDAPIEYQDFTLPEGSTLDPDLRGKFTGILAEAKVPQEAAQKLVDLYGGEMKKLADAAKAPYQAWNDTQREWQSAVKADAEIGGASLEPMKKEIAKVIDAIAGNEAPALRKALAFTGAGNNPEVLRFLYRAAQAMNEGATVEGGQPTKTGTSFSKTLYPTMN